MAWKDYIPIVGDAINLIGGAMANRANAKENEKNREWSEKMWHLNNEYNLPVNQIQRFQDAGLNPALAYGEGTSSLASYAGNMSASRGFENPAKFDTSQIAQLQINRDIAESQIQLNEAQAYKATAEGNQVSTQNEVLPVRLKHEISILGYDDKLKELEAFVKDQSYNDEIKQIYENAEKAMYEKELTLEQKKVMVQKLVNLAEEYENLKKQGKVLEAEELLTQAKVVTEQTQQESNRASAFASITQGQLNKSAAALNYALVKNQKYIRQNLNSQTFKNYIEAKFIKAGIGKTKAERDKLVIDAYNAIQNGQLDRFLKRTTQKYGTGTTGNILGLLNEAATEFVPRVAKDVKDFFKGDYDWNNDILFKYMK